MRHIRNNNLPSKQRCCDKLMLVILLVSITVTLSAQFGGGQGTANDPWQIALPEHLDAVREYLGVQHTDKYFVQTADIDLGQPPYNVGHGWTPIGMTFTNSFQANFNGNGYIIDNLTINTTSAYRGLFGYIRNGHLTNVHIRNANVRGFNYTAFISAYTSNSTIVNSSAAGVLQGARYVGGITGYLVNDPAAIRNCYVAGEINGNTEVGGITGYAANQIIRDSYSTAIVRANGIAGGLVGYQAVGCQIRDCYASGAVIGDAATIGGLIGSGVAGATTINSYWDREASGRQNSFRGTGLSTLQMMNPQSYTGWDFENVWNIVANNSYPYLRWQQTPDAHNIPAPFNLTATAGNTTIRLNWQISQAIEPQGYNIYRDGQYLTYINHPTMLYNDNELENFVAYEYYVTAVFGEEVESSPTNRASTIPYIFAGGNGTVISPYLIDNAYQLSHSRYFPQANFRQTSDINLGVEPWIDGQGWLPIGDEADNPFRGIYDGNGFSIANLTIDRYISRRALFGYISGAAIRNLRVINASVTATTQAAALVGEANNSTIQNCYASGVITGTQVVGLITGLLANNSNITQSFSSGRATATGSASFVGGIVGQLNSSTIRDSYSAAVVFGLNTRIGGIAGAGFSGSIIRCYATGSVSGENVQREIGGILGFNSEGTVTNSFWNFETTGQMVSAGGGTARSILQMLERNTYADWDFNQIWTIGFEDEPTYPWLRWQQQPLSFNFPPPPPARDLIAIPRDERVVLEWVAPVVGNPTGYAVYRNSQRIATIEPQLIYTDQNVENFVRYHYEVAALYTVNEAVPTNRVFATPVTGGYGGGRGTTAEPFEIDTVQRLDFVRYNPDYSFIQTEDIDLEAVESWMPIGSARTLPFTGSFDGNGHLIANLTINSPARDTLGLFGLAGADDTTHLLNIRLDNLHITGGNFLGGIVGRTTGRTLIRGCYVSGEVISESELAENNIGGIIGYGFQTTVFKSYSAGTVTAENDYVGGIAGRMRLSAINSSYSTAVINGRRAVGGLIGSINGEIRDSYARGNVNGSGDEIAGFVGNIEGGVINASFSTGRVAAPQNAEYVAGFAARLAVNNLIACYWDINSSGRDFSPGANGRTTAQMTFPYDWNSYRGWDFTDVWVADSTYRVNDGYPYLRWQPVEPGENPHIASNPLPRHLAINISIEIDSLRWEYLHSPLFALPVGFRVYFNDTGEFEDDDEYLWVPYEDEHVLYAAPVQREQLSYMTHYYWKVVPTTNQPARGDAENVPVWRFTTATNPCPVVAHNPQPADGAEDIPIDLERLSWSFTINQSYTNPAGFRIYFNETGDFEEDDDFHWVAFVQHQTNYASAALLPEELELETTCYWKVVPTTSMPNRNSNPRVLRAQAVQERDYGSTGNLRLDAEDVEIWSFTTYSHNPYPQQAVNPNPEHLATGVSVGLTAISWDYIPDERYTDPVGFRVYMNTTGAFGSNAPYVWADYVQGQVGYSSSGIVPAPLDENRTYYWRIVPTTIHPTRADSRNRNDAGIKRSTTVIRTDAQNCPVWRFTTGIADVGAIHELPLLTEMHRNYPNPFNPETTIRFSLAEAGEVSITVYNSRGQQLTTLVNDNLSAGAHTVIWNGRDDNNREVGSGIYLYRMKSGSYTSTNRMVLIK